MSTDFQTGNKNILDEYLAAEETYSVLGGGGKSKRRVTYNHKVDSKWLQINNNAECMNCFPTHTNFKSP